MVFAPTRTSYYKLRYLSEGTFRCKYLGSVPVAAARLSAAMWTMFGEQVISTAGEEKSPELIVIVSVG